MNGEDLVYDWQHNVVDEPTEWAFNWDYSEGGTSDPTPRPHRTTMWLIMNVDNPIQALRSLFTGFQRAFPCKLKVERDDEGDYKLTVTHKTVKKKIYMRGTMADQAREDGASPDPNVGNYAVFQSTTEEGTTLIKKMVEGMPENGMRGYIPHDRVETILESDSAYRVVSITGFGPGWSDINDGPEAGLATRFTLYHEDEEVARCHMTYKDGSWDPSIGPTIEMIAVKQSRRGEGLANVLWYYVRKFVEDKFTIECLNNDAPMKHTMIKATQIGQNEVDIRKEKDGSMHPLGFKELLYDYCGFSVRPQKGAMAFMMGNRRPKDEEAVLYIPLVDKAPSPKAAATARNRRPRCCPKPGNAIMREKCGARMCHWCTNVSVQLLRCNRCGIAFYCNATCQKSDWKRHKVSN